MSFFNTLNLTQLDGSLVFDAFATKNSLRTSSKNVFLRLQSELLGMADKLSQDGVDIGTMITDNFFDRQASYMLFLKRSCDQVNKTFIEKAKEGKNLEFVISVDNYTMKFHAGDFLKPHFLREV
jgi:hypothetical protein